MPDRMVNFAVVQKTMKDWEPFTSSVMKCDNHYLGFQLVSFQLWSKVKEMQLNDNERQSGWKSRYCGRINCCLHKSDMLVLWIILKCITHRLVDDQKRTLHVNSQKQQAKINAVKEHIKIIEIGFGCHDVHIGWYKNGRYFTGEKIRNKFIEIVISFESKSDIPPEPRVNFPSRCERTQLGTRSKDLDVLEN